MSKVLLNVYYKEEYVTEDFKYYSTIKDLNRILKVIAKEVKSKVEASLHFVDKEEIKALNNEHRALNMSTDVLSFPHNEMEDKYLYIGDVFINIDQIEEQAELIGSDAETEVKFLAMHGFLHLIGYDHIEKDDEESMTLRQREIFTKLKIRDDLKEEDKKK